MTLGLAAFLSDHAARPFAWGRADCCLFACDWIVTMRGIDPAMAFRGRYATERGALRLIRRSGGLLNLVDAAMALAGLVATNDPRPGDVGVIATDQGDAMAIRTRLGWAAKSPRGVVSARFAHLKAWRI